MTAAALTFLLLVMGGVVCVTDSSQGCPDWPGCYGQLVPPAQVNSIIEYTHRVLAAVASLFIVILATVGWRRYRDIPAISRPPMVALFFLVLVVILGAMVVLRGLAPGLAAVDLGSALIVLALVIVPPVSASYGGASRFKLSLTSPYARLVAWAASATFLVLVSAVLVADSGSAVRCLGWPLATDRILQGDWRGWLQLARFIGGTATALLIGAVVLQAWRTQRDRLPQVVVATALGAVLLVQVAIGAALGVSGSTLVLLSLYAAFATILWALVIVLLVLAALPVPDSD